MYYGTTRNQIYETKAFLSKVNKFSLNDIICIDETSISLDMKIKYCRSKIGTRCYLKTDTNAVFKKFSIIFAISNSNYINYVIYDHGAINGDRFLKFIENITKNTSNKLLVCDNAAIHKISKVKDTIITSGNKYLYTVPYSPWLNPIENFFSKLKHSLN